MRYRKSAVSSSQIVQAAIRVLARQGYARTSLLDIAREAGMSKGAVHYHFPTKEALLSVVLKTACDAVQERTIQAWSQGGSPLESLRNSVRELWAARSLDADEVRVVADLLTQSLHDESLRPQLAEFYALASEQVQEYLGKHLPAMGLEPQMPLPLLSRVSVAMLDGLLMQVFVDPEAVDPEQLADGLLTIATSLFRPVASGT